MAEIQPFLLVKQSGKKDLLKLSVLKCEGASVHYSYLQRIPVQKHGCFTIFVSTIVLA